MGLTKCNTNVNVHSSLSDAPSLTATELKTAWDSAAVGIKNYLNDTLTEELDNAIPPVINDLATGGATKALSAEQGKVLNTSVNALNTSVSALNTAVNGKQKIITSGQAAKQDYEGSNGDIYLRYA